MTKKRFKLGIILLVFTILSYSAYAQGCCVGLSGCDPVIDTNECDTRTSTFIPRNCQDVESCDLYACCAPPLPPSALAQPFFRCNNLTLSLGDFDMHFISEWQFSTQPFIALAQTKCTSGIPSCTYRNCEDFNPLPPGQTCWCGNVQATSDNPYCCSEDSQFFPDKDSCTLSASCQIPSPYSISGTIVDSVNGFGVGNALVTAGSKTDITAGDGTYTITGLRAGEGFVIATANNYAPNSTNYFIRNTSLTGIDITLEALRPPTAELCDVDGDEDGDGAWSYADPNENDCDKDCNFDLFIDVLKNDERKPNEDICNDGIDNDCDGLRDCFDPDCVEDQSCVVSFCGDGKIDPGETCENCPADAGQCPAICGNEIIERGEECDGRFDPVTGAWTPTIPTEAEAPSGQPYVGVLPCGSPTSLFPCRWGSVCGDDIAEPPEECDGYDDANCPGLCANRNNVNGPCVCIAPSCGDGVRNGYEECDGSDGIGSPQPCGQLNDGTPLSCNNECRCELNCLQDPRPAKITSITPESRKPIFNIEWDNEECFSVTDYYHVHSCKAEGNEEECTVFSQSELISDRDQLSYPFEFLPETEATYCFVIETLFSGDGMTQKSRNSSIECVTTGNLECYENENEFCLNEARYNCKIDNTFEEEDMIEDCLNISETEDYICVGPKEDETTECAYQSDCDECNGMFGMFFKGGQATILEYSEPNQRWLTVTRSCDNLLSCYIDYSETAVDKYHDCINVESCYDYRSKEACDDDPCFINNEECEFIPHFDYDETGFGVCRPLDTEKQYEIDGCQKCSDLDLPNNYVFGACTPETCSLYGDCYYLNKGECRHKKDISCWHLANWNLGDDPSQTNCNNTAIWRNDQVLEQSYGPANAVIGANFDDENRIIERSDDYFDFGVCKWGAKNYDESNTIEGCVKDADGDGIEDCESIDLDNPTRCMLDMTPPNTTIPHHEKIGRRFKLPVITEQFADTFACVVKATDNQGCYPDEKGKARKYRDLIEGEIYENILLGEETPYYERGQLVSNVSEIDDDTNYVVYYYSRDFSRNLEELRSFPVEIDANEPEIIIENSTQSQDIRDSIVSNLTITMTAINPTTNLEEDVECSAHLEDDLGTELYPAFSIRKAFASYHERVYPYLSDGFYHWVYSCVDQSGNEITGVKDIKLEEDTSITNPQPLGTFGTQDLVMSVETQFTGTCRFEEPIGTIIPIFNLMNDPAKEFTLVNGDVCTEPFDDILCKHEFPISGLGVDLEDNKFYRYYVACELDKPGEGKVLTQGNAGDVITFAIDVNPPNIKFIPDPAPWQSPLTLEWWYNDGETVDQEGVKLGIDCIDDPIWDSATGTDWSFGCDELYYCRDPRSEDCNPVFIADFNDTSGPYNDFITDGINYVNAYGIDKGGIKGDKISHLKILYDPVSPTFDVRIQNDAGEEVDSLSAKTYKVNVTSSQPLQREGLELSFVAGDCRGEVLDFQSTDGRNWTGTLIVDNRLPCAPGKEQYASISVKGVNNHNRAGNNITTGLDRFYLDTTPPRKLEFTPLLTEYQDIDYPMRYVETEDKYYAGDCNLFVTGQTEPIDGPLDVIVFQSKPKTRTDILYSQPEQPIPILFETTAAQELLENAGGRVYFDRDISRVINDGMFLGFSDYVNPAYGSYGKYFDIQRVFYQPDELLAHYLETEVTVNPPIEEVLEPQIATFYGGEVSHTWFGVNLGLKSYDTSEVYFKVADALGNELRRPARGFYDIFCDPDAPIVENIQPLAQGTTNLVSANLTATIKERKGGPGMFRVEFVTDVLGESNIEEYACGDFVCYDATFSPAQEMNGTIYIELIAEDMATNIGKAVWDFTVDVNVPATPTVEFEHQVSHYKGRNFLDEVPSFVTIDFSQEATPVQITGISLDGVGAFDIPCTGENNVFTCALSEEAQDFLTPRVIGNVTIVGDYVLRVDASKILTSGLGNRGQYYVDFSIDSERPDPKKVSIRRVENPRHIQPNAEVSFTIDVPNEIHDLEAEITIENNTYPTIASRFNGSDLYTVDWRTPNLAEEEYPVSIKLTDKAGNEANPVTHAILQFQVFIDRTPPRADQITVRVTNPDVIPEPGLDDKNYRTKTANSAIIEGTIPDTDIEDVYAVKGEDRTPSSFAVGVAETPFSTTVILDHEDEQEIPNLITIVIEDEAGYVTNVSVKVTKDLKAPSLTHRIYETITGLI